MLKLGSNLAVPQYGNPGFIAPPSPTVIYNTLYEDNFSNTFVGRQVFSSRSGLGVTYPSDGTITFVTGATTCGALVHFDCLKDKYPSYNNGLGYAIGDIVYGGYYGHGLFQRTGNPGNPGYPPIISQAGGTQDASGWTRYRPTTLGRLEKDGDGTYITFDIELLGTAGTAANTANVLRFGIFDSNVGSNELPKLINVDNFGGTNSLFGGYSSGLGYRGYMMTYSGNPNNVQTNWKRLAFSSNLMSSTGTYAQVSAAPQAPVGMNIGNVYNIGLEAVRINDSVEFKSYISGTGINTVLSYVDNAPETYNFDTCAINIISNVCSSYKISQMVAESYTVGFYYP